MHGICISQTCLLPYTLPASVINMSIYIVGNFTDSQISTMEIIIVFHAVLYTIYTCKIACTASTSKVSISIDISIRAFSVYEIIIDVRCSIEIITLWDFPGTIKALLSLLYYI